jgi:uncharacterized membrane protein YecN with MAPEG domain
MIEILAALSASAAAGIRIALPLLIIGVLQGDNLWSGVPILSRLYPPVVLGILTSWSLIELFASKKLLGQRLLQIVQLVFSPIVGAIMAIAVAEVIQAPTWLIGLIGGLFAFLLQLVQAGWFYRWHGLPPWLALIQDSLCVLLVFLAVKAPQAGGMIALILLGLAVFSAKDLHRWYLMQQGSGVRRQGSESERTRTHR